MSESLPTEKKTKRDNGVWNIEARGVSNSDEADEFDWGLEEHPPITCTADAHRWIKDNAEVSMEYRIIVVKAVIRPTITTETKVSLF